jgi:hypothetical protein
VRVLAVGGLEVGGLEKGRHVETCRVVQAVLGLHVCVFGIFAGVRVWVTLGVGLIISSQIDGGEGRGAVV